MFDADQSSDLTIKCQGIIFRVHRLIVCLQSKPLATAVDGRWKESVTDEIVLDDDKPEIVAKLIKFFYNQTLDLSSTPDKLLLVITKVYVLADKYDVPALKCVAIKEFTKKLSDLGGPEPAKGDDQSFPQALKLMYDATPETDRGLKKVAVNFAVHNVDALVAWIPFAEVCKAIGEIGFDMVTVRVPTEGSLAEISCPLGHVGAGGGRAQYYWCNHCKDSFLYPDSLAL